MNLRGILLGARTQVHPLHHTNADSHAANATTRQCGKQNDVYADIGRETGTGTRTCTIHMGNCACVAR